MSKTDNQTDEERVVYLGYIEDGDKINSELTIEPEDTTQASSSSNQSDDAPIEPWLVNKVGGLPTFPCDKSSITELESILDSMKCKNCKGVCVLIFQINSPIDDSHFDRVMQIYTCMKNECTKHSWFALRCMFKKSEHDLPAPTELKSLEVVQDTRFGPVLICRERSFFEPYFLSVIEEPTGKENFTKNNLEALKLASKFEDPDLKPASIEEKYKNMKNYKPPKPPASLTDLDDFEKFQMERLYGNDKDMYRFYKRVGRYQSQVCRYDWEGEPLLNSNKIKLSLLNCPSCGSKRKFEFQLMSALINYLKTHHEFDRESQDFSSILVHSCSKNCSSKTYNLEDTYFMPDPDSRIFNKVKHRMLALKIGQSSKIEEATSISEEVDGDKEDSSLTQRPEQEFQQVNSTSKSKKNRRNKKKNKQST